MVVAWSPSSADFAGKMKETLEKSPEQSSRSSSPNYEPVDAQEYDGGSSSGDDEDDF